MRPERDSNEDPSVYLPMHCKAVVVTLSSFNNHQRDLGVARKNNYVGHRSYGCVLQSVHKAEAQRSRLDVELNITQTNTWPSLSQLP